MYKIVIADDEPVERRVLRMKIESNVSGVEICATVEDGEDLLKAVRRYHPDIAIVDIEMPGMNGLDAISVIRSEGLMEHGKIIIYTAYSLFQYAQTAIKSRVDAYLLKPATIKELVTTIETCIESLEAERKKLDLVEHTEQVVNKMKKLVAADFIASIQSPGIEEEQQSLYNLVLGSLCQRGFVAAFAIKIRDEVKDAPSQAFIYDDKIVQLQKAVTAYNGVISRRINNEVYCYIPTAEDGFTSERYGSMNIVREILEKADDNRAFFYAGIGRVEEDFPRVFASYRDSFTALHSCEDKKRVIHIDEIEDARKEKNVFWSNANTFKDYIHGGKRKECELLINTCYFGYMNISMSMLTNDVLEGLAHLIELQKERFTDIQKKKYELQELYRQIQDVQDWQEMKRWHLTLLYMQMEDLEENDRYMSHDCVYRAVRYIKDNYWKDISLGEIAASIGISQYYLSRMFVEETGKNYTSYLTVFRIEQACMFLERYNYPIKELAGLVGFNSVSYFCKVFKKIKGVTVGDYKAVCNAKRTEIH